MKRSFSIAALVALAAAWVCFGVSVTKVNLSPGFAQHNDAEGREHGGPDFEREYFSRWHYPEGYMLSAPRVQRIMEDLKRVPKENPVDDPLPSVWTSIGPWGMTRASGAKMAGRILDIEAENNGGAGIRIAAASGGLWGFFLTIPVPLSDRMNSLAIGTFKTHPTDRNTIFIGTGEPLLRSGTGLYRTTNGGTIWSGMFMDPLPTAFYRIRYTPGSSTRMHAATDVGYFRSTDGGTTWTRFFTGDISDIAIHTTNTSIMYFGVRGDGVYKTINGGDTWSRLTTGGIPTANVGRIALSIAPSSPSTVYASVARSDNNGVLGVYKTTNDGTAWSNVAPPENFLGGQGWYDNVIGVSPTNQNVVLVGGIDMWRTVNGGTGWTKIITEDLHSDHHAITWKNDGTAVWVGNDGGMSVSLDAGVTWSTEYNTFPITQYVDFDVDLNNPLIIGGGSQDNGISLSVTGGDQWEFSHGGDGSDVAMDVSTATADQGRMWVSDGFWLGNWAFVRRRSTNFGSTWTDINNGIDPSNQWYHQIRTDLTAPVNLYNNSGPWVYRSTNFGDSWQKLNTTPFGNGQVRSISVARRGTNNNFLVYASIADTGTIKLKVYDNGTWFERSTGLPSSGWVRTVSIHPRNSNIAYALMGGIGNQEIFRTTNRGASWTNISGDLLQIPVGDLVADPRNPNYLYLGTEFGFFRSTNGGGHWAWWNDGLPDASIVTRLKYVDSTTTSGRFILYAATYGRGIWKREVTESVTGVAEAQKPEEFDLAQNYPNPFNPTTQIRYGLPHTSFVTLTVYNTLGQEVTQLVNEQQQVGYHDVVFRGDGLASGVYFYRIQAGDFVASKKLLLLK